MIMCTGSFDSCNSNIVFIKAFCVAFFALIGSFFGPIGLFIGAFLGMFAKSDRSKDFAMAKQIREANERYARAVAINQHRT